MNARPLALAAFLFFALLGAAQAQSSESADYWYAEARRLLKEYAGQVRKADAAPQTHESVERAERLCALYRDRISGALDEALKAGNYACHMDPPCKRANKARYERTTAEMIEEMDALCPRGGPFVVVSITGSGAGILEVGLKDPLTGAVHSVAVAVDVGRLLHAGDRVRERHRGEAVILDPIGRSGSEEEEAETEEPSPFRPVGEVTREPAPNVPPCIAKQATCPPPPADELVERPLDLARLRGKKARAIARAAVPVASMSFRYDPSSLAMPKSSGPDCQVLASGSFNGNYRSPVGPLKIGEWIVKGNSDKRRYRFTGTKVSGATTLYRGALVLDEAEGIPRIVRQDGDLSQYHSVMGGGALLLEGGHRVSADDLCCCQAFVEYGPNERDENGKLVRTLNRSTCGFGAGQFASGIHIVVASKGGQVYVLALQGSGAALRDALYEAGFDDAVKLDGGSGAFMIRGNDPVFDGRYVQGKGAKGQNSQTLCITELPAEPENR